ncbi:calcium-binding protein [Caenimonas koreensis]|uniref:Ca2+-binding protein, RTX toxin-related n=1 Tax=Caenimonas koreensis DSM 17982 TaxID=1121255 RepID=A0A844AVS5_9BURK|nr:hypothetical protein [Caenimonas koreensis]MRD48194.1 hypothetical protein [Caenimonas koreensis DSM 17982]
MATVTGTEGQDTLVGTDASDVVNGLGGNDALSGGGANDSLSGGDGADTLAGGAGADTLDGGAGNDALYSHAPSAEGLPMPGYAGPADGSVDRGTDADVLTAGAGDDALVAGWKDKVDGGAGIDTLYISFAGATSGVNADFRPLLNNGVPVPEGITIAGAVIVNIEAVVWVEGSNYADLLVPVDFGYAPSFGDIYGLGGDDTIVSNDHTRYVSGGTGNDLIDARAGGAWDISGDDGADTIYGGNYAQNINGGAGDDEIQGGLINGRYNGGTGNDVLLGGASADDVLHGDDGDDTIYGGAGGDFLHGDAGADLIYGDSRGSGLPTAAGDAGDDWLLGGAGNDTLYGEFGNDTFEPGEGDDSMEGGAGNDTVRLAGNAPDYAVVYNAANQHFTISDTVAGRGGVDVAGGVELFVFADSTWAAEDFIAGRAAPTAGNDSVLAGSGNDSLYGGFGHDTLAGGAGADTLTGGPGIDYLYSAAISPAWRESHYPFLDATEPVLDTGAEVDVIDGGADPDVIFGGYGDKIDGGMGEDILLVSFMGATSGVNADFRPLLTQASIQIGTGTIANIEGIAWLEGSNYDDVLAPIDTNYANGPIYGRGGNDLIIAAYLTADIFAGDGNDTVDCSASYYTNAIWGEQGNDHIIGGHAMEQLFGGIGNDSLEGHFSNDMLYGGDGVDTLDGGPGSDLLTGDAGDDLLYGAAERDTLEGGDGNDTLHGDASPISEESGESPNHFEDTLIGGAGDDDLYGEKGDDLLFGGQGDDLINGGAGVDVAYYLGNRSEYTCTYDKVTGIVLIADSFINGDGVDAVVGVELFSFSDGVWSLDDIVNKRSAPTGGDETYVGGPGNDSIFAGAGDDLLMGMAGADTLDGGTGDDWIFSNELLTWGFHTVVEYAYGVVYPEVVPELDTATEADSIMGGDGDDSIFGGWGDHIDGGAGTDGVYLSFQGATTGVVADFRALNGGAATVAVGPTLITNVESVSWLQGSEFADFLAPFSAGSVGGQISPDGRTSFAPTHGGGGNDTIYGSYYSGPMYGDAGDDLIDGSLTGYQPHLHGGTGNDTLIGGLGAQAMYGDEGDDVLIATNKPEAPSWSWIFGGDGNDALHGADGDETLDGGEGNDTLDGGKGIDVARYETETDALDVNLALGSASGGAGSDVLINIESVWGGSGSDLLTGDEGPNRIEGNAGSDTIEGGGGDDFLDGSLYPSEDDWVVYTHASGPVLVELYALRASGSAGQDTLYDFNHVGGSAFNDTLIGDDGWNRIDGGTGNDSLNGRHGRDTLMGGIGNDTLEGGLFNDSIDGGDGNDVAVFTYYRLEYDVTYDNVVQAWIVTDLTPDRDGQDTVTGVESFSFAGELVAVADAPAVKATTGADVYVGTSGANHFNGLGGADTLSGAAGNDTLEGAGGDDRLSGDGGNDSLVGGPGLDVAVFTGGASAHVITFDSVLGSWSVSATTGPDGTDSLASIERLEFQDFSVALDLDGNAGVVALLIGTVFGEPFLSSKSLVGIALDYLDHGGSELALVQAALDYWIGPNASNSAYVETVYSNLFGSPPAAQDREYLLGLLDAHVLTQVQMTEIAMHTTYSEANIGYAGLQESGLAYSPF